MVALRFRTSMVATMESLEILVTIMPTMTLVPSVFAAVSVMGVVISMYPCSLS